jgi:hypothetical protein
MQPQDGFQQRGGNEADHTGPRNGAENRPEPIGIIMPVTS